MEVQRLLIPVVLSLALLLFSRGVEPTHEAFSQATVPLPPCVVSSALDVSVHSSLLVTVPPDLSHCNDTQDKDEVMGFRISTRIADSEEAGANSASKRPVIFTARQSASDGFVSWNAPLNLRLSSDSSQLFSNVSHTMCPVNHQPENDTLPLLYIDAFTSATDNVSFTMEIEPVKNFMLHINQPYTVEVGPASPQVYYFKVPSDIDLVTVEASSEPDSNRCTIVSIQNHTCPVNDLLENVRNKGIYQTMSNSSFITINPNSFTERAFLLVLVEADYSLCYPKLANGSEPVTLKEKTINITIRTMPLTKTYVWAMMLPVVFCAVIYILSVLVCCCYAPRIQLGCIPVQFICAHREDRSCCCCPISTFTRCTRAGLFSCVCGRSTFKCCAPVGACSCVCWHSFGTADSDEKKCEIACCGTPEEDVQLCIEEPRVKTEAGETTPLTGSMTIDDSVQAKESKGASVYGTTTINGEAEGPAGAQTTDRTEINDGTSSDSQNAYHVYSWNTVTVGIFYALPAIQLVFSEQKILDNSGDQDSCYYNFKCAHPVWMLSAFNNIWSNIGYILLGFLFLLIVFFRHWQYIVRRNKYKAYMTAHGVPQFFGVYYAMGFALIIEGFMSSFYHICPSNANFQFDTAFMFITGGIILVKVYQNRHPKVQANAFIAFFTFAVIIFFTLVGIYNDGRHPFSVKIIFLFFALVVISLFLAHFYKWKFELDGPVKESIFDKCNCSFKPFTCLFGCCSGFFILVKAVLAWLCLPGRWKDFLKAEKYRVGKHSFIFGCNVILGIVICVQYNDIGIATGVLTFFVANIIIYLAMYCVIKICYGEPWTWLAIILPVFIALTWRVAFHFYGTVTEWKDTPAVSRGKNHECIVYGFYDSHDVWHFFSACGMFTAFLFVLVIDDGVVDIKQNVLLQRAV